MKFKIFVLWSIVIALHYIANGNIFEVNTISMHLSKQWNLNRLFSQFRTSIDCFSFCLRFRILRLIRTILLKLSTEEKKKPPPSLLRSVLTVMMTCRVDKCPNLHSMCLNSIRICCISIARTRAHWYWDRYHWLPIVIVGVERMRGYAIWSKIKENRVHVSPWITVRNEPQVHFDAIIKLHFFFNHQDNFLAFGHKKFTIQMQ